VTSWKWTTSAEDFIFITKDVVIVAWIGKDVTIMKSGDMITYDPHAYTLVFKKMAGEWKIVYSHDSGTPVMQKAGKK
jgi:ABC-type dipeptide/oligopeptide/nickel transport system ATPase component